MIDIRTVISTTCTLSSDPSGYIDATDERLGVKPAPKMADFSSRGPNAITPQIIKVR